jgi:hypothetical protein
MKRVLFFTLIFTAIANYHLHLYYTTTTTATITTFITSPIQIIKGSDKSEVFRKMWKSLDADGGGTNVAFGFQPNVCNITFYVTSHFVPGTCSLSELECWIVQVYTFAHIYSVKPLTVLHL